MITETHFQKRIRGIERKSLKMAAMVEEAIRDSVQSLVKRDSDLPRRPLS